MNGHLRRRTKNQEQQKEEMRIFKERHLRGQREHLMLLLKQQLAHMRQDWSFGHHQSLSPLYWLNGGNTPSDLDRRTVHQRLLPLLIILVLSCTTSASNKSQTFLWTIIITNFGYSILHCCRLPEAKHFLTARVQYLENLDKDPPVHHALATTHYLLQNYNTALSCARKAVEEAPGNQELLWHLELVVQQNTVLQEGAAQLARISSSENLKMPRPTQVKEMNGALIYDRTVLQCPLCIFHRWREGVALI